MLKAFVERQNIKRYADRIKTESDPVERDLLATLLAEEKAKQVGCDLFSVRSSNAGLVGLT